MKFPNKPTVKKLLAKVAGNKGKDSLWYEIENRREEGLEYRRPYEQRWAINLAFLAGRQYVFFNQAMHSLIDLKKVQNQIRSVDNKLLPKWRRQVADLIKNAPEASVVPNSNEPEDRMAAKVGDKVLKSFHRTNKMDKKLRILGGWICSCGNGFLDDRWDRTKGPISIDPKSGKMVYEGDVDAGVWSPFEIITPPLSFGGVELDDLDWLIKQKFRSLSWIRKHYPKKGAEVKEEDSMGKLFDMGSFLKGKGVSQPGPGAFVPELYIQPCSDFPKGMLLTGANGVILDKQDYPFDHYHLEHFKDIEVPGQFFGKATLEDGIGIQRSWNQTKSSIQEFNRSMGKGKILVPKGSKMERVMDDKHGEEIHYKPVMGHKVEQMTLKGLPATYNLMLEIDAKGFDDLFSQHEVSQGTNKSDIRSGEMVSLLREQDAHGNIPMHAIFEEGLESFFGRVLQRIQKGYTSERVVKVIGREHEFEVFKFKGADLRGNTDVWVKKQSSMPESRTAREALILKKAELGLFGDLADPEVRRHVMNMLDEAVVEDIYSDTRLDETYARFENRILSEGKKIPLFNLYDNHAIHVKEHNHFRKEMDYQKLRVQDYAKFIKTELIFSEHIKKHEIELKRMEQAAMQRALIMGGAKPSGTGTRKGGMKGRQNV